MATSYSSDRLPTLYAPTATTSVGNGTMAKASIINSLADNHIYLATGIPAFTNFFLATTSSTAGEGRDGAWTNATKRVRVPLCPFSQYVEFWFYAFKDFQQDSATQAYIKIDGRYIRNIPAGEDIGATGKSGIGDQFTGAWVTFSGVGNRSLLFATDPAAIEARATAAPTWGTGTAISIEVSQYCYVRAAAYRVLTARGEFAASY